MRGGPHTLRRTLFLCAVSENCILERTEVTEMSARIKKTQTTVLLEVKGVDLWLD